MEDYCRRCYFQDCKLIRKFPFVCFCLIVVVLFNECCKFCLMNLCSYRLAANLCIMVYVNFQKTSEIRSKSFGYCVLDGKRSRVDNSFGLISRTSDDDELQEQASRAGSSSKRYGLHYYNAPSSNHHLISHNVASSPSLELKSSCLHWFLYQVKFFFVCFYT